MNNNIITLGHGSGCALTRRLIDSVFRSRFQMPTLDDSAALRGRAVISTDAHVIKPLFFPGGDIGKLSISGTVNDIAVCGAVPEFITAALIIEEGFPIADLERIADSMQKEATKAGVKIIAGDTKVVERGQADGLYIVTTGVGYLPEGVETGSHLVCKGDSILVNGTIGDHAVAIINAREEMELEPAPESDCASLQNLTAALIATGHVRFMRDATRGGVVTVLNELSEDAKLGIIIDEEKLPVTSTTKAVCGLLGLDPLYLANEGKLVAVVNGNTKPVVNAMRQTDTGRNSVVIGRVTDEVQGVYLRTSIGSLRRLFMPESDPLPRIC
ncbi:MAG: hydrogenase expression/formation protein HypE [Candidatus Cloacimonetes bacterium]|nr:hydrogenase expression/formation protein HypE [Candidatus Cloacimonadota bacterium]